MSERPTVDIAIVAWPVSPARLAYAQVTIEAMRGHLVIKRHEHRFIASVGAEHDPKRRWCGKELTDYLDRVGIKWEWRSAERERLGYAMNETVRLCSSPYVLLVQDDSLLTESLDLSDAIDLMEADKEIDIVRLAWSKRKSFALKTEPYKPGWLRVRMDSVMPYADNPHVRRSTFADKFGTYNETRTHGPSEKDMLNQTRRHNALIVVPDQPTLFVPFGAEPADFRERNRLGVIERLGGPR